MAGFLRRKSKNQERERAPTAEPSNGSYSTPIFARLTTSSTSSGQQPHHARSPLQGHVSVSQPRILGSTGPHRAVTLNRTTDPGRQLSLRHDAHGTPGQSAYPKSRAQQAQVSRTASATVTTPSQRQVAKSLRRVPALQEKPLPTPVPEDDDPPIATVQTNEQTSLTQRGLVSQLSHHAHPPQLTASPPSAHEIRAQQYKGEGVTIDSPRQLQENQVFGQHSTPMPPPDSGVVVRQPLTSSQHFSQKRPLDDHDIRLLPRTEMHGGQRDPTPGSAREPALAPKHTVAPPHQTENRQVYANGVSHRATIVDEHVASAYSLRTNVLTLESKLDRYGDSVPSSSQTDSYRSVSPVHIPATGLGNTISSHVTTTLHDINLDRPLPSRPVTGGQDSENGDAFVDAAEEIKETTPALDAGEASPEIMLYRVSYVSSIFFFALFATFLSFHRIADDFS
jgi:hypothetical protein